MSAQDPRLGWRRPAEPDPRDLRMELALQLLPTPGDEIADMTFREAHSAGYLSSWAQLLELWRWIKRFFRGHDPKPAPTSRRWLNPDAVLNQGATPRCVAFAATQWLNTDPVEDHLGEPYAAELYAELKQLDGDDDPGTTVHQAARALRRRGRIGSYVWTDHGDVALRWVLTQGPVQVGTPWTAEMMETDDRGFLTIEGDAGDLGHSYDIVGAYVDESGRRIGVGLNSWGPEWGDGGYFYFDWAEWVALLLPQSEVLGTTELPLATLRREAARHA